MSSSAIQEPVQCRSLCIGVTPDASYRFQYDTEKAQIFFSYLPEGETLIINPQSEDAMQEDEEHQPNAADNEATMDDDDATETNYHLNDGNSSSLKRTDSGKHESAVSVPASKRAKLK